MKYFSAFFLQLSVEWFLNNAIFCYFACTKTANCHFFKASYFLQSAMFKVSFSIYNVKSFYLKHEIHQQTPPKLLTIWSTYCNNTVNNRFDFYNMVNNIATILFVILSISTILLQYMITILLYIIVRIANNVTIL